QTYSSRGARTEASVAVRRSPLAARRSPPLKKSPPDCAGGQCRHAVLAAAMTSAQRWPFTRICCADHRSATTSPIAKPPRHLLEHLALVAGEAFDPVLRDLVEHPVELLRPRFAPPRAGSQRRDALRRDRLALRNDVVHLVAALTARQASRNRA